MLKINEVIELRKQAQKKFGQKIHYHDACGGQYFSLDESNDNLRRYIEEFAASCNVKADFSEDGKSFSIY